MDYLSTDKILIIDLATAQVEENDLEDDLVSERIGGAGITRYLYDKYADEDPIVLGTGLLTGTMCPASASGLITAKSPVTGKICHSPINYKIGIEMKFSGFDYIVVKGVSAQPAYLWIHDGVADIADATDIWGKDVWESTNILRRVVGDDLLQTLLIGPAGETGSNYAQVCCNHWSSPDRFGFGKLFGNKNLKGFAFRGMGLLEVADPEQFVEKSFGMLENIKKSDFMDKKGVGEIARAMGEADIDPWLAPVVHRHSADYFTPVATNTAMFINEDPGRIEESQVDEPGVLVSDIPALIKFNKRGLSAKDTGRVFMACAKYGIDPFAVASLSAQDNADDIINSFTDLSGEVTMGGKGIFSPWCPITPIFNDFGLSEDAEINAWWERRQALALIFGIQPIFSVMCPELSEENLIELVNIGTELDISRNTLDDVINQLCE